jgi:hypothetical protein
MNFPSDEFDAALAAVCDGVATERQSRALVEILRGNTAARDAYLFAVELHARLASDNALFFTPACVESGDKTSEPDVIPFPAVKTAAARKAWPLLACAAALAIAALLAAFYISGGANPQDAYAHVLRSAGAEFLDRFEAAEGAPLRDRK